MGLPPLVSPLGQMMVLGAIFFFVFTAYYMEQGFASDLFGATLASDVLVALYAVFTAACFVSPGVVNRCGIQRTLFLGAVGYASLSVGAFVYSMLGEPTWARYLVIACGGLNGLGAALLWTAQGALILEVAAANERQDAAFYFAVFWGLFNSSAVAGGIITFAYFSESDDGENAPLYGIFTVLIVCGAFATSFARPPGRGSGNRAPLLEPGAPKEPWNAWHEVKATLALFTTRRALALFMLFWYSGFSTPYQLDTFGDRFFRERIVGLELAAYYAVDVAGAFVAGRMLDDKRYAPRTNAARLLAVFVVVNTAGYAIAGWLEREASRRPGDDPVEVAFDSSAECWILTTAVMALWGYADSHCKSYCYWILGALYTESSEDRARGIGYYKFVQSAGWCVGFALMPKSRCSYQWQLYLTAATYLVGVGAALLELPGRPD